MTRDEALLKLLAIEPETRERLPVFTGWPVRETAEVLDRLVADGRVTFTNWGDGIRGRRYYPAESCQQSS